MANIIYIVYEPDSDMDFVEFRERMKKEWANRKFK